MRATQGKTEYMHSSPDEKQNQHAHTARHPAMQAKESASGVCVKPVGHLSRISNQAQHIPNHQSILSTQTTIKGDWFILLLTGYPLSDLRSFTVTPFLFCL